MELPDYLIQKYASLAQKILSTPLPLDNTTAKLNWKHSKDGDLTKKIAYDFIEGSRIKLDWCKLIWSKFIPPTISFITWRLAHNKLPTYENLKKRGSYILSICCFCKAHQETSSHIFFECLETSKIWQWIENDIDLQLDYTTWNSLLLRCTCIKSSFTLQIMLFTIITTIWLIWLERNKWYFQGIQCDMLNLIHQLIVDVHMRYPLTTGVNNSSITDFKISQLFRIHLRAKKQTVTTEVYWQPPQHNWVKINIDGSAFGSPSIGSIGGIFRNQECQFLGGLEQNIGNATTGYVELCATMFLIEKAIVLNMHQVWIEIDSLQVIRAFNSLSQVPWQLRTRWENCLTLARSRHYTCSHIFREGNIVDALAKNGQNPATFALQWWDTPSFCHSFTFQRQFKSSLFPLFL